MYDDNAYPPAHKLTYLRSTLRTNIQVRDIIKELPMTYYIIITPYKT